MNKRQQLDIKIVRAKINAEKAVKKYLDNWYAEEPKEVKRVAEIFRSES